MKVKVLYVPMTINGNKEETQTERNSLVGKEINVEKSNEGYTKNWYNLIGTDFWWSRYWLEFLDE